MSNFIPLCKPCVGVEESRAVLQVLESGVMTHGPMNEQFEEEFAKVIGVKHAISMNSCTSALHLALECQGIRGEVILPSFTFVASANAIVKAGAKPVFIDIRLEDLMLDPSKLEECITPQTEAVMVVHYAGLPADMKPIVEFCERHGLALIEDSAECIGGTYDGKVAGSFGTGCFSFFPTKNLTTGEGGMFTTNDDALASLVRRQIAHGIDKSKKNKPWERIATEAGYNFRMSNLLAAIGVEQVKKLSWMNEKRREHAAYLRDALADKELWLPRDLPNREHVYQMFPVLTYDDNRDQIVGYLNRNGIGASAHFDPPVHQQGYGGEFTMTEWASKHVITLPMYPTLSRSDLDRIVTVLHDVI